MDFGTLVLRLDSPVLGAGEVVLQLNVPSHPPCRGACRDVPSNTLPDSKCFVLWFGARVPWGYQCSPIGIRSI